MQNYIGRERVTLDLPPHPTAYINYQIWKFFSCTTNANIHSENLSRQPSEHTPPNKTKRERNTSYILCTIDITGSSRYSIASLVTSSIF